MGSIQQFVYWMGLPVSFRKSLSLFQLIVNVPFFTMLFCQILSLLCLSLKMFVISNTFFFFKLCFFSWGREEGNYKFRDAPSVLRVFCIKWKPDSHLHFYSFSFSICLYQRHMLGPSIKSQNGPSKFHHMIYKTICRRQSSCVQVNLWKPFDCIILKIT